METLKRGSVGKGPPALVMSLVTDHIGQKMHSPIQFPWLDRKEEEFEMLLKDMSLVHRSWTSLAQELMFRRLVLRLNSAVRSNNRLQGLLQSPHSCRVQELTLILMEDDDSDQFYDFGPFLSLWRRLTSLRKVVLSVFKTSLHLPQVYSGIAQRLPELDELRLDGFGGELDFCVNAILRGRIDAAPITLKSLSISAWPILITLSPVTIRSMAHHESDAQHDFYLDNEQIPDTGSSPCSLLMDMFGSKDFLMVLFNVRMRKTVWGDMQSRIQSVTLRYHSRRRFSEDFVDEMPYCAKFLDQCTSLNHMNMAFCIHFTTRRLLPGFPRSLQTLSIYIEEMPERQVRKNYRECHCDEAEFSYMPESDIYKEKPYPKVLHAIVDILINQPVRTALSRIEVIICRNLCYYSTLWGMGTLVQHDTDMGGAILELPPDIVPLFEMLRLRGVELVMRVAEFPFLVENSLM